MSKKSFIRGAAILAGAGILIKIIGAVYRIALGNILTTEASSYYAIVYPWYNGLLVFASAAVPAAIARLVSEKHAQEDYHGGQKVLKIAFRMLVAFGVFGAVFMLIGAEVIPEKLGNPGAAYAFKALAVAVFFVSMMAAFRGYFQGLQELRPFAISQITEQLGRVIFGFVFVFVMLKSGDELSAAGATFGASAGAAVGFFTILLIYLRHKKYNPIEKLNDFPVESGMAIIKKIMIIAIPITLGSSVVPLLNMIDSFIVINRLTGIGFGDKANDMYGYIAFFSVSIINLPQVLITAVQISLLPAVSELMTKNDTEKLRKTINTGIKVSSIIGIPAAIGISFLSKEILSLLYPTQPEVIANASSVLGILGIGVIFLAVFQSTTGALQGMGKQFLPARNLFIGAIAKVFVCYILVGIPSVNINGAAISTLLAYFIAMVLNMASLSKHLNIGKSILDIIGKPLISGLIMGVLAKGTVLLLGGIIGVKVATVLAIAVGGMSYLLLLFVTQTFTDDDFEFIPGKKIIKKLYRKLGFQK